MIAGSRLLAVAVSCLSFGSAVCAGEILDRVRRDGILHCAAVERPGYAEIEDGKPTGRAADLCRAVADGLLGPGGRFALRLLDLDSDFDHVRRGEVDLVFLEPRVVTEEKLSEVLTRVGEAYRDRFAVLLPQQNAAQTLSDLSGKTLCFMIGDPVWPVLSARLQAQSIAFRPFGFSEDVEMKDAYNVGRCDAVAGAASALDELRHDGGVKHLRSRLLAETLGNVPIYAMAPARDPAWIRWITAYFGREPQ